METWIYTLGVYLVIPLGMYMIKSRDDRFKTLEEAVAKKLDEDRVRQLLTDRIDPIKEDIHEMRVDIRGMADKFEKVIDLLIDRK